MTVFFEGKAFGSVTSTFKIHLPIKTRAFFLVSQNHYGNFILRVFYFGSVDQKSIALPAELQGHNLIIKFFSLINQLNQSIINAVSVHNLSVAHTIKVTYV